MNGGGQLWLQQIGIQLVLVGGLASIHILKKEREKGSAFSASHGLTLKIPTWLSVVVTPPVTTVAAERAATGEAEADVVGVVPFKGFGAVLVASFTSWNFSMNWKSQKVL